MVWHVQVEHLRALHADVPQLSVRQSMHVSGLLCDVSKANVWPKSIQCLPSSCEPLSMVPVAVARQLANR